MMRKLLFLGLVVLALAAAAPGPRTLSYGADPAQQIDVWAAPVKAKAPLVLFVHGGGWQRGNKSMVGAKPAFFAGRSYAFASVEYRMVPQVAVRDQAADLAAAIAKLREQAATLNADPDRIALIGHSAGAQLAALVATDPAYLRAAGVPMTAIRVVELLDGAGYDVPKQVAEAGPMLRRLYLQAFGSDRDGQWRVSPLAHAAAPNAAAFSLHVDANRRDSPAQADALAAALRQAGAAATVTRVPDTNHMQLNRNFGLAGDPVSAEVAAFFDRYL